MDGCGTEQCNASKVAKLNNARMVFQILIKVIANCTGSTEKKEARGKFIESQEKRHVWWNS